MARFRAEETIRIEKGMKIMSEDAPKQIQHAEIRTVYDLIADKRLAIPVYQRPYKWTEKTSLSF